MGNNKELGDKGEAIAANYLQKEGYRIEARNYRYSRNEIDIIARNENLLVFVEVKTRTSTYFGYPEESVTARKAALIMEAAENYIFENNWQGNIRFDIIAIEFNASQHQVHHFPDAFF